MGGSGGSGSKASRTLWMTLRMRVFFTAEFWFCVVRLQKTYPLALSEGTSMDLWEFDDRGGSCQNPIERQRQLQQHKRATKQNFGTKH